MLLSIHIVRSMFLFLVTRKPGQLHNLVSMNDDDRILKDVIENNDNEFIFAPLDINQDKPNERNSNNNNTAEDISNDGIYLALQDSIKDRQT
ncbi:unnamed protein product [Rotaria sp. Silwood2]|nr:unnamed protein product [Rotaria sp. Silwood2]CAF4318168.1 unnamed protein product [Rotaria sp. Silwood2]